MKQQRYENHVRYYPTHHFIFYPIVLVAAIVSGVLAVRRQEDSLLWGAMCGVFLIIGWLSYMMRQHYALMIQNRTVRVELRLRFYILTMQRLELYEKRLTEGQLYALRFASDEEFVNLLKRAADENLSPDQIKKEIGNWQADNMRV